MTETPDTAQHAGRTALLPAHDAADTLVRTLPAPDADSVRTPAADTLAPLFAAEAADTLPVPVRTVAPAEVYGAASYPGAAPALPDPAPLAGDPLFQLLVLLTASFCALFAARHAADIVQLFSRTVHDPGSLSDARSNGRDRFLLIASVLGLLLAGIPAVAAADRIYPPGTFPGAAAAVLSLAAAAAFALSFAASAGMLRLIGVVTLSGDFTDELLHLRTTTFAAASLLAAPAVLLHALCPGPQGAVWRWLLAADIALVCALFLIRSLRLFLRKKIPILHWILYLCAVELFPLSLVWLSIARQ